VRYVKLVVLGSILAGAGYVAGIFPATFIALAVGPLRAGWPRALGGVLSAVPYVLAALALVWRLPRTSGADRVFLLMGIIGLLAAALSSGVYFVLTLESQF
jgi:hypothetical protein